MSCAQTNGNLRAIANRTPRRVHCVRHAVFVVCADDQHGHRIHQGFCSKIFAHNQIHSFRFWKPSFLLCKKRICFYPRIKVAVFQGWFFQLSHIFSPITFITYYITSIILYQVTLCKKVEFNGRTPDLAKPTSYAPAKNSVYRVLLINLCRGAFADKL